MSVKLLAVAGESHLPGNLAATHFLERALASSHRSDPCPTSVYRYYDQRGVLIYVGITSRAAQRNREHNTDKEWWPHVTRQEVEHYPTRPLASAREKELIRSFQPPFNRHYNPNYAKARAAYETFAQVPEDVDNYRELVKQCKNEVPLHPFHRSDETGTWFRTEAAYWPVAARLLPVVVPSGHVTIPGSKPSRVIHIEQRFPFGLIHVQKKITAPIKRAWVAVRWSENTKPKGYEVRTLVTYLEKD